MKSGDQGVSKSGENQLQAPKYIKMGRSKYFVFVLFIFMAVAMIFSMFFHLISLPFLGAKTVLHRQALSLLNFREAIHSCRVT